MNAPEARIPSTAYFVARLIAYQPILYAINALAWILYHSWPLTLGLLAKAFFDTLAGQAPAGLTLTSIVALALALGLAKVGIIFGAVLSGVHFGIRKEGLLRRNLIARILDRPGAMALPGSVGEAISTLRDDVGMMGLAADWAFDAFAGLIFAGGGIAILLWVDARVTLLVFVPIVLVITIAHAAHNRIERARERSRAATARVTGSLGEIFGAVQAIQVAGAEASVIAHLGRLGDERRRMILRDRLQGLALDAIFANTASLGAGLTLLVAASEMRAGTFTVGDFALFATYLMQVADYTGFLGYLIASYRQSGVAYRRGAALLQGAPAPGLVAHHPLYLGGPPAVAPIAKTARDRLEVLEVTGLTLRHPQSGRGIEDVSFTLRRGSFTVITGRIGAGKTTLLRALLGLLDPQAGAVYWNGRTIERLAEFFLPPRVAYTPQVPTLLSGTLRDAVLLGLPEDEALTPAIHRAALERDLASFPNGLDTLIGTRGMKLSGGQIQRAAAARMFVRDPELLVVDDLSSALDVETERTLWDRLQIADCRLQIGGVRQSAIYNRQSAILAVSHRRAVLERADQILVLEDGRLSARGTLAELLETSEELRRLYTGELGSDFAG